MENFVSSDLNMVLDSWTGWVLYPSMDFSSPVHSLCMLVFLASELDQYSVFVVWSHRGSR